VRENKESRQKENSVFTVPGRVDPTGMELKEQVIQLNRVAKVVKGGRRFSFSALVVVGDGNGHVGVGFGKANEVPESIQKAVQNGRRNLIRVSRVDHTLPYAVDGWFGAAHVVLRPASQGTGIIAGPAVRAVLELAGLQNVLTKSLGASNVINILKATIEGLRGIRDAEATARMRGKTLEEMVGKKRAEKLRSASQLVADERRAQKNAPAVEAMEQSSDASGSERLVVVSPDTDEVGTSNIE
jgi:small subunit ribosomal protein S5